MPPKNTYQTSANAPRRSSRAPIPRAPYQPSAPSDKMKKTSAPKSVKRKSCEDDDDQPAVDEGKPALNNIQPAWKAHVAYPTLGPVPSQRFREPSSEQVMGPPNNKPAAPYPNENIPAPAAQQPLTAAQMARELLDTKRSRDNLVAVNADLRRQLERKDTELNAVTDAKYKDKEMAAMAKKLGDAKQANVKLVVTNNEYHKKTKIAEKELKDKTVELEKAKERIEKLEDYEYKFKALGGEEAYLEVVKEKYGMK